MEKIEIEYLYYYKDENHFTDCDGRIIYNIFTMITPQDLYLFRHDHGDNTFRMKGNRNVLCEITYVPDEVCGVQDNY